MNNKFVEQAKEIAGKWGHEEEYWWKPIADSLQKSYVDGINVVINELSKIVDDGIEGCKYDVGNNNLKGKELHYVFGKSQALKIIKMNLENIILKMIQVIPINDTIKHIDGYKCPCNPSIIIENGKDICVHNALDGRE